MSAFRKKPVTIQAHQWFKNGDHPQDNVLRPYEDTGNVPLQPREGEVVRYYRHPEHSGESRCEQCGGKLHYHGWIDTLEQGHRVCPGDWIITGVQGERYPCKPAIFDVTYEAVQQAAEGGDDTKRGLYSKFDVRRLYDPHNKHAECEYFVLDLMHDKHAAAALLAYADSCEAEFPQLAADLRHRVGQMDIPGRALNALELGAALRAQERRNG